MRMRRSLFIVVLSVLASGLSLAWGQDSSPPQEPSATPEGTPPQQPAPAYGPENTAPIINDNPPVSGLDLPNLEPHGAPLSYIQAGAHVSEAVDSNVQDTLGGSSVSTITNALGSVELQRLWSHYDFALDYIGGVGYYDARGIGVRQIEELGAIQKVTWKRGQLGIRDGFSYQPEGSFGGAYGSVGSTGAALGGDTAFFGGNALGALGQVPRIMNLALVDVVESLSPKSSLTAVVGYGFVHFLDNNPGTGTSFIGNSQLTAAIGYSRVLGPHDQAGIEYAYEGFDFSTGLNFHSHVIQLIWGHRISGKMDLLIAAGPQLTQLNNLPTVVSNPNSSQTIPPCTLAVVSTEVVFECPENDLRISAAGRGQLRYRFPKASVDLTYQHFLTGGSGFFAGAESDILRLSATRPLNRVWTGFTDIGFSRNSRVVPSISSSGVAANKYDFGFAGLGVRRNFGRTLNAYASYQFNYLSFDSSYCATAVPCSRTSQRNVGTIGLDWTPRPYRID